MTVPTTDSAMYQTMHRQPEDLRRLLETGWEPAGQAAGMLSDAPRVFVVGIGTSYHAAQIGAWLLCAAGCDARAVMSFDFVCYPEIAALRPGDAVIVMAHSGVKQYSSAALRRASEAGATVLSVGSLTAEHPGSQLVLRTVERETSATFTASHTAAMLVLAQIATVLGEGRDREETRGFRAALAALPEQVAGVLAREEEIAPVSREAASRRIFVAGAGPNAMTATEAVIKAREAAQADIDALPLEQFIHGPMVSVNAGDLVGLIHVPGPGAERTAAAAGIFDAIGAQVWLVGEPVAAVPSASLFRLPQTEELISPLLAVVPMQILAYQMAALKGINPDRFRRDDPTYAAAFGQITL